MDGRANISPHFIQRYDPLTAACDMSCGTTLQKSLTPTPGAKSGPRTHLPPAFRVLMAILSHYIFLVVRADLSSPSGVTNTHYAETANSACQQGPEQKGSTFSPVLWHTLSML